MFDVEKLVSIVCEVLENENEMRKHNREIRRARGLDTTSCIWISLLDGSTAYRTGELSGQSAEGWRRLSDICDMLDIDRGALIAAVKSMQRWERHNGRWDRDTAVTCWMSNEDKKHLEKFIKAEDYWTGHYVSTGRKKAWCN